MESESEFESEESEESESELEESESEESEESELESESEESEKFGAIFRRVPVSSTRQRLVQYRDVFS